MHANASPAAPSRNRLLIALVPALTLPFFACLIYFVYYPGTAFGKSVYVVAKLNLFLWPLLVTPLVLRLPFRPGAAELPVRRHLHSLLPSVFLGLAIVGAMFLLLQLPIFSRLAMEGAPNLKERVIQLGVLDHFLLFAAFISFLHSFLEEFYWRWFVFGNLRHLLPLPAAHLVAAAGFSAHHYVVLSQFFPLPFTLLLGTCVGIGGLFWSLLYHKYQTLLGPWLSHALVDLGLMAVGYQLIFA